MRKTSHLDLRIEIKSSASFPFFEANFQAASCRQQAQDT
jgi:hypothetical protein